MHEYMKSKNGNHKGQLTSLISCLLCECSGASCSKGDYLNPGLVEILWTKL